MFALNKCLVRSCQNLAVSSFGKDGDVIDEPGFCMDHAPNPGMLKAKIYDCINENDTIVGLNASGMIFADMDFSGKRFYGCNFQRCFFKNVRSEGMRSRMSMFDFSTFDVCAMLKLSAQFSSFGGCSFAHTLFTGSDLAQDNFNGVQAFQCAFDDSDLYSSRFVRARLTNTSFRNCNVKKTMFLECVRENVSFKMSNTREAIFDSEGSALFQEQGGAGGAR